MLYDFILLVQRPQIRARVLLHWLFWALATGAGWALAGFAGLPIGQVVVAEGTTEAIFFTALTMGLLGMLIGGLIGVMQWMYLRRRVTRANWWIVMTAFGWGVGLPIVLLINLFADLGLSTILYGVVIGITVGASQWLLLRRMTHPAGHWVWISVVAIPIGIVTVGMMDRILEVWSKTALEQVRWSGALSSGVAGIVVGFLTGTTLLVFLSRRK